MTNEERIAELDTVVRAQGRLLGEILGWMREWDDQNDLVIRRGDGRELLDMALKDVPPPLRKKWFGKLMHDLEVNYYPEHDQP